MKITPNINNVKVTTSKKKAVRAILIYTISVFVIVTISLISLLVWQSSKDKTNKNWGDTGINLDLSNVQDKNLSFSSESGIETIQGNDQEGGEEGVPTESLNLPTVKGFSSDTFNGTATTSYSISAPSGPSGLSPSISLSYSSGNVDDMWVGTETKWRNDSEHPYQKQSSSVGLGWNLSAGGSISRDTNGSMDDLSDDIFAISFSGGSAKLIPVDGAETPYVSEERYVTSPDLFIEVVRKGSSNGKHWRYQWEVKDGNGNIYKFGTDKISGWFQEFDPSEGLDYTNGKWYKLDASRPWIYSIMDIDDESYHVTIETKWNLIDVKDVFDQHITYTWGADIQEVKVLINCSNVNNCDPGMCNNKCRDPESCCKEYCPDKDCTNKPKECDGCNCNSSTVCKKESYASATYPVEIAWGDNKVVFAKEANNRLDIKTHLGDNANVRNQRFVEWRRVDKILVEKYDKKLKVWEVMSGYKFEYQYIYDITKHNDLNNNNILDNEGEVVPGQVIHSILKKITQYNGDPDTAGTERLPASEYEYSQFYAYTNVDNDSQYKTYNDIFLTSARNGYGARVEYGYWNGGNALEIKICNRERGADTEDGCLLDHSYNSQRHRIMSKTIYDGTLSTAGTENFIKEEYQYSQDFGLASVERYPQEEGGPGCQSNGGPCNAGDTCNAQSCGDYGCYSFGPPDGNLWCASCPSGDSYWNARKVCKLNEAKDQCDGDPWVECACKCRLKSVAATDFEFLGYPEATTLIYEKNSTTEIVAKSTTYYYQASAEERGPEVGCFKPSPIKGLVYKTVSYNVDYPDNSVYQETQNRYAVRIKTDGVTREVQDIDLNNECTNLKLKKDIILILNTESRSKSATSPALCTKTASRYFNEYGSPQQSINYGKVNCGNLEDNWDDDTSDGAKYSYTLYTNNGAGLNRILPKPMESWVSDEDNFSSSEDKKYNHTQIFYDNSTQPGYLGNYGLAWKSRSIQVGYQTDSDVIYDNLGRPIQTIDTLGRSTYNSYDDVYKQFPKESTNTKGQKVQTIYDFDLDINDPRYGIRGLPVEVHDLANGTVTYTEYDSFGRTTAVYLPGRSRDQQPNLSYLYYYFNDDVNNGGVSPCTQENHCFTDLQKNGHPAMVTVAISRMAEINPTSLGNLSVNYTFYDGIGQKTQTRQSWVNEEWGNSQVGIPITTCDNGSCSTFNKDLLSTVTFTATGQVEKTSEVIESEPYILSNSNTVSPYQSVNIDDYKNTTNFYDGFGRQYEVLYPDGSTERTIYYNDDPLKTTVLDKNCTAGLKCTEKTSFANTFGQTAQVQEIERNPDGAVYTTKYQYNNVLGVLESTIDTNNVKVNTIYYDNLGRKMKMWDIDMTPSTSELWEYEYDKAGNLIYQKDPENSSKGYKVQLCYDELNRLLRKEIVDVNLTLDQSCTGAGVQKRLLEYRYDEGSYGIGKKSAFITYDSLTGEKIEEVNYQYDIRGQITSQIQIYSNIPDIGGRQFTTSYTYDEGGRLTSTTLPEVNYEGLDPIPAEQVVQDYSGPFLVKTYSNQKIYAEQAFYNKDSQLLRYKSGNGVVNAFEFNEDNKRLENLSIDKLSWADEEKVSLNYDYDEAGNIEAITDNTKQQSDPFYLTQIFNYDPLYRLKGTTDSSSNAYYAFYNYDSVGNILTKQEGPDSSNYQKIDYLYSASDYHRPDQVNINGKLHDYTYDKNGNLINDGVQIYTYDIENRLRSVEKLYNGYTCNAVDAQCSSEMDCKVGEVSSCVEDCSLCVPEIDFREGTTSIVDGGEYDFGDVFIGNNKEIEFTIVNNGKVDINLNGSPKVEVTGEGSEYFVVSLQPQKTISPGNSAIFKVNFSPNVTGQINAELIINNNDTDENPYNISIKGQDPGVRTGLFHANTGDQNGPGTGNIKWTLPEVFESCSTCRSDDIWGEVFLDQKGTISKGLRTYIAGFDDLPENAEIEGIQIDVEGYHSPTAPGYFSAVWLYDGTNYIGSRGGDTVWPDSHDQVVSFGGSQDKWNYENWSTSKFDQNMSAVIIAKIPSGKNYSSRFYVDLVTFKVYFKVAKSMGHPCNKATWQCSSTVYCDMSEPDCVTDCSNCDGKHNECTIIAPGGGQCSLISGEGTDLCKEGSSCICIGDGGMCTQNSMCCSKLCSVNPPKIGIGKCLPGSVPSIVVNPGRNNVSWSDDLPELAVSDLSDQLSSKNINVIASEGMDYRRVYVPNIGGDEFYIQSGNEYVINSSESSSFELEVTSVLPVTGEEDQVQESDVVRFIYDGEGQRMAKIDGNNDATYYISPLIEISVGNTLGVRVNKNYYFGGSFVAVRNFKQTHMGCGATPVVACTEVDGPGEDECVDSGDCVALEFCGDECTSGPLPPPPGTVCIDGHLRNSRCPDDPECDCK